MKNNKKILRLEYKPLAHLLSIRWEQNPKAHTQKLIDYFKRFGFIAPVIVNEDESGELLVAGHGRTKRLNQMKEAGQDPPDYIDVIDGEWWVPAIYGLDLGREDAEAYAVADNRLTEKGDYDHHLLGQVFNMFKAANVNVDSLGWSKKEIEHYLSLFDGGAAPEVYPEPQDSDFWPILTLTLSPETKGRHELVMKLAEGGNSSERLQYILDAVQNEI